jgi:hypothetical protein
VVMMVNDPGAGMLTAHELRQSLDGRSPSTV